MATCVPRRRVSVTTSRAASRPSLIPTPAKPMPSPRFSACSDVVIPGQLPALHAAAIVDDGHRRGCGIRQETDAGGSRVERVGDDFREDRFLEGTTVRVTKVFEQMLEIDTRFAHIRMLPWVAPPYRRRRL